MTNSSTVLTELKKSLDFALLPKKAIGHEVTNKIAVAHPSDTALEINQNLSKTAQNLDTLNYIYVVSEKGYLKGVISIHELFSAEDGQRAKDIMKSELVYVHPKTNREKAIRLAIKHGLKSIPVVDDKLKLIGAVTGDKIMSILDQETEEDLLKISGIVMGSTHKEEESDLPVRKSFAHRIPWIMFGLFGGIFTAKIIGGFEGILKENLILAGFIPLIAYIANAVGVQTQTIYIRDSAVGKYRPSKVYILRQFAVSILIAITCWLAVQIIAAVFWNNAHIGSVIGFAVFCAILVATFFALFIPIILQKLKLDPAIGSGPFSTIIQDLLSIVIYFYIASLFL